MLPALQAVQQKIHQLSSTINNSICLSSHSLGIEEAAGLPTITIKKRENFDKSANRFFSKEEDVNPLERQEGPSWLVG